MQTEDETLLALRRPVHSCDPQDMKIEKHVAVPIIWAYGNSWGYHGLETRGMSAALLRPSDFPQQAPQVAGASEFPQIRTSSVSGGSVSEAYPTGEGSAGEEELQVLISLAIISTSSLLHPLDLFTDCRMNLDIKP